ncbi:unnamed protein product [marine sediment metagenome]|uniref:PAS domain-containing protein n=1 Tax=marine sediment metagenome TaxID=412755 RepID=X1A5J8_9ZZZZ
MSKVEINEVFTTKLRDDTFLHFAERSTMGILIIQRGYLQYFNQKFTEIFGYNVDDILKWRKKKEKKKKVKQEEKEEVKEEEKEE